MVDPEESPGDESVVGFFDGDGKWITLTEFKREKGDELETPAEEVWNELAEIGMLRVQRDDDGTPVTAQLSAFARDLYELPEDATVDEHVAVYVEHGRTPPDDLREAYQRKFRQNVEQRRK